MPTTTDRGTCPECARSIALTTRGVLHRHGALTEFDRATDNVCSGSGQLPTPGCPCGTPDDANGWHACPDLPGGAR
jgi:hypothetical protein